jgi:hypothetical protein
VTQYEQIIDVLKKLGGKATVTQICDKMDFSQWKTKTPRNSVSRYLTCSSQIKQEIIDNNYFYIIDETIPYSDLGSSRKGIDLSLLDDEKDLTEDNNIIKGSKENEEKIVEINNNGLYFICLSSDVNLPVAGSLFKIGRAGDLSSRMDNYKRGLPFDPIRQIAFFPVPLELNLPKIENELRTTLISSDDIGINRYIGGNQREWLQTLFYDINDRNQRNELVLKVNEFLNDIIEKKLNEIEKENN